MDRLMTIDELARYLQKPKATLYAWSSRGEGPAIIKCGRELRYRVTDVEAWLNANRGEAAR